MPKILSFKGGRDLEKENVFKSLWEQFKELDKFVKVMFVSFLLIALSTPAIVLNNQVFNSQAQKDIIKPTTAPIQNTTEICMQFESLKVTGEITCQEAIDKALSLYKGQVTEVIMANNLKKAGPENANQSGIKAWKIAILLDQPQIENGEEMPYVRITLNRHSGNIFSQYFFK